MPNLEQNIRWMKDKLFLYERQAKAEQKSRRNTKAAIDQNTKHMQSIIEQLYELQGLKQPTLFDEP